MLPIIVVSTHWSQVRPLPVTCMKTESKPFRVKYTSSRLIIALHIFIYVLNNLCCEMRFLSDYFAKTSTASVYIPTVTST